jgi:hypothetical protein
MSEQKILFEYDGKVNNDVIEKVIECYHKSKHKVDVRVSEDGWCSIKVEERN